MESRSIVLSKRPDERQMPTRSIDLTAREAKVLYDHQSWECDRLQDGGTIPPQHWRTAAEKLRRFLEAWTNENV